MISLLSACGGGGGSAGNTSGVALFTSAAEKITISPGEVQTYNIGGGIPAYIATSSSSAVSVQVSGKTLRITGGNGGSAVVAITDAAGAKVLIEATVGSGIDLYTSAPSTVSVGVGGTSAVYRIGGGSQVYLVTTSDTRIASVGQTTSREFVITGQSGGKAVVTVKDTLGKEVKIDVVVGTVDQLFSTAAKDVTIEVGGANTYKVGGGSTIYAADSSNIAVATAKITGNDLVITGVSTGKATVVVRDSTNGSLEINVTVGTGTPTPLFTTASPSLVVAPSTSPSFTIGGGRAPYRVSSSNASIVTATVSGTNLTLNGVAKGSGQVIVTDSAGTTVTINVTVGTGTIVALFTTAPGTVTIVSPASATYSIGGGSAPYTVTSSNVAVASVTSTESGFTVKGESSGNSQILIRDSLGASVTVNVTVTAAAAVPVAVLPGDSTGAVGDTLTFNMSGGSSPYTVSNNNPSIATVTQTGNSFTAKLLNVGSTKVTVFDSLGKTVEVTITASAATSQLRISPATITVGEDSTNDVSLTIYGGTGPYRAFTSDLVLSSVPAAAIAQSANGTAFVVGLGSKGNRCMTSGAGGIVTLGGTYAITLTVLDSNGASATSTMNIKDNSKGGVDCN
ncbi:beta strand repeat-containing protein [Undibacterium baiyunense]|uniref:beta strand repeat-containing protein n=1 Tax=Undibacterium baiyunense TaxID=2828731 RepID=UPI001BAF1295|nr:hypothetical protein [Undibacterium baiyunense]